MFRLIWTIFLIVFTVTNLGNKLNFNSIGKFRKRIVRGENAQLFEFPFQTELQIRKNGFWGNVCGGVLVTPIKVLTAAHCVVEKMAENARVSVGMLNIYGPPNEYEQTLSVSKINIHENYENRLIRYNPYDLAVLTLATPARLNKNVQPARFAENVEQYYGKRCMMSGWGLTNRDTGTRPNTLQKAQTTMVPNYACADELPEIKTALNDGMYICVYDWIFMVVSKHAGPCGGDSGGPLMCGPNFDQLVGILSLGVVNCTYINSIGKFRKRIVRGENAQLFEFPFQTELQIRNYGFWGNVCGGVLVTPNKVLTAAHCVVEKTAENARVSVGMLNIYGPPNEYEQTLSVSKIYIHENYENRLIRYNPYDLAVLTLATPARLNKNVQPARFAENVEQYYNTRCMMSGWGLTNSDTGTRPNTLQKAQTTMVPNYACANELPEIKTVFNDGMYICVYDWIYQRPAMYVNLSVHHDWLSDKL
ncbi:trypsin iota-like isoform X2 [Biomphalaria glabrata]|uniref:Trypsin iota-like isoform X2 n=1 Tax=Biomphalaria glabrata TaxID=6526 RepID=A0A9W3BDU2_BIOGL|nr:trypsin iota-like isoform X2 [Biomphalaria glabrata]